MYNRSLASLTGNKNNNNNNNNNTHVYGSNGWIEREIYNIKKSYEEEIKLLEVIKACLTIISHHLTILLANVFTCFFITIFYVIVGVWKAATLYNEQDSSIPNCITLIFCTHYAMLHFIILLHTVMHCTALFLSVQECTVYDHIKSQEMTYIIHYTSPKRRTQCYVPLFSTAYLNS